MADNDKDRAAMASSQGAGPGLTKPDSPASPQAGTSTSTTSTSSRDEGISRHAGSSGGPSGTGKQMADDAKHYAEDMAGRAKEQGRTMFEQQKHSAARQVDSVAHAFRGAAIQLRNEEQSQASQYVTMAADRLESFGQQLRHKNMDTLIDDVENLGRRAPGTFFAGSVVAGFLFARFLKSSAERRHGQAGTATEVQRSRPMHEDEQSRFPVDVRDPVGGTVNSANVASGDGTGGKIGLGTPPSSSSGSIPGGNSYGNR